MKEAQLAIEGMHCDGCVRRATAALKAVPGVVVDGVEVGAARLRVTEDDATAAAARALQAIGFPATAKIP